MAARVKFGLSKRPKVSVKKVKKGSLKRKPRKKSSSGGAHGTFNGNHVLDIPD